MENKNNKLYVAPEFRKNDLSEIDTDTRLEVHIEGDVKVYNNIHYPHGFAKKVFANNPACTHIEVISADGNYTINRS
tara:strand:- start:8241 stop:8471 length:231 start_codon:yes stop_codon:yes gene_type:complete